MPERRSAMHPSINLKLRLGGDRERDRRNAHHLRTRLTMISLFAQQPISQGKIIGKRPGNTDVDTKETDWRKVVRESQTFKKPSSIKPRTTDIVFSGKSYLESGIDVHPDHDYLDIIYQFGFGQFAIRGKFIADTNNRCKQGQDNPAFYAPIEIPRGRNRYQAFLTIATLIEKQVLITQIQNTSSTNEVIELRKLSKYDPGLKEINPDINRYDLEKMAILNNGNTVTVTYPRRVYVV